MAGMRDPLAEDPPPSRFDPEELDIFAPIPASAKTPPSIDWESSVKERLQSGKLQPQLLILALSKVATRLIHHLPDKKPIGSVILPETDVVKSTVELSPLDKTAVIYSCNSSLSVLLVSVQYHVPEEGASLWTKTLFQAIQPERVLILAHTPIYHFRGKLSSEEPSFFLLETDEQKRDVPDLGPEGKELQQLAPYFPSGSLVDGLAASLLTHCQLRGLKGRLLLTWPVEDNRMAQILAATLTDVLRLIPEGPAVKFSEAVKIFLSKKPMAFNNMYI